MNDMGVPVLVCDSLGLLHVAKHGRLRSLMLARADTLCGLQVPAHGFIRRWPWGKEDRIATCTRCRARQP